MIVTGTLLYDLLAEKTSGVTRALPNRTAVYVEIICSLIFLFFVVRARLV
jgi:hypothetical protein